MRFIYKRVLFYLLFVLFSSYGFAQTFTVDNLGDTNDNVPGNGICADGLGNCTLRAAIEESNALAGAQTITFSIAGTITLGTALPAITGQLSINGYSAPGAVANTLAVGNDAVITVIINGNNSGHGLIINPGADGTVISGLEINGWGIGGGDIGLWIGESGTVNNVTIRGCRIGSGVGGNIAVQITNNGTNILIGGTNEADRNIIANSVTNGILIDNTAGVRIFNNYIGTNPAGTMAQGNNTGIRIQGLASINNQIGGNITQTRNVISGNTTNGILIINTGDGNLIRSNYIGVNAGGTADLGNGTNGISITNSDDNTIGATGTPANIISGNNQYGIHIIQSDNIDVFNNYIGTDASGTVAISNTSHGIVIGNIGQPSANCQIGTSVTGATNIISGNGGDGVLVQNGSDGNLIRNNYIGVQVDGVSPLGNAGAGITVNTATNTNIGNTAALSANVIAFNGTNGITIIGAGSTGNRIFTNSIHSNTLLGIDIGNDGVTINDNLDVDVGANELQNFPVLTSASVSGATTTINGTLNTTGLTTGIRVEFYGSATSDPTGYGEGQTYLGFVTIPITNGAGNATFSYVHPAALADGTYISAIATPLNTTVSSSEFSANIIVNNALVVTNTSDPVGLVADGLFTTGSLREAILESNFTIGTQETIRFNIPTADAGYSALPTPFWSIRPLLINGSLPVITDPVIIDGWSQTGFSGSPLIEINGININNGFGLNIQTDNCQIRGLIINNFNSGAGGNDVGIGIFAGVPTTMNNWIYGCYIGTDATGNNAVPNDQMGIWIGANANGNLIGTNGDGTNDLQERNIISGNGGYGTNAEIRIQSTNNRIKGNYIGTNTTGTADISPADIGIFTTGDNTTVGVETVAQEGNLISGFNIPSTGSAVYVGAKFCQVRGNLIGVNAAGSALIANTNGIRIQDTDNIVGGTTALMRNIISGNSTGIDISTGTNNFIQGNYIGTNINGTVAIPNFYGINMLFPDGATVGGSIAGSGNVISGNQIGIQIFGGSNNLIQGNFIGTNASGTAAIPNIAGVVLVNNAISNIIGGTVANTRNIISGNSQHGITINGIGSINNQVIGNYIGTDVTGNTALGNGFNGVFLDGVGTGNSIGGAGARNIISGNLQRGIYINQTSDTQIIRGNYIGTNTNGNLAIPNALGGIFLFNSSNTVIGGNNIADRNIISGNSSTGIAMVAGSLGNVSNNTIQGNYIGTDVTGNIALPNNGSGVSISDFNLNNTISNNAIGGTNPNEGNTIAYNLGDGINLSKRNALSTFEGNLMSRNVIFANQNLGIDLAGNSADGITNNDLQDTDTGANDLQNYAVLTSSVAPLGTLDTEIQGIFNSTPASNFRIEFFANPANQRQGRIYMGFITLATDGVGDATINTTLPNVVVPNGYYITATATNTSTNNTSEFAAQIQHTNPNPPQNIVTNTNDSGIGSLRNAITFANLNPGLDTIKFNIPDTDIGYIVNGDYFSIKPLSPLPILVEQAVIDGFTQPNTSPNSLPMGNNAKLRIEIEGDGVIPNGLILNANNIIVRGLCINRFATSNILIDNLSLNNSILGCFIGTNIQGTVAKVATAPTAGILINGNNNTIGTGNVADRNLISGANANTNPSGLNINSSNNLIVNNYIGTNAQGTANISNTNGITINGNNNTIGGTTTNESNLIAQNINYGIGIGGLIIGNSINRNTIFNNGQLGIDLGIDGVTANDANDGDVGANDLQNFPTFTEVYPSGGSLLFTNFNLNTIDGNYKIDFYANNTKDPSGYGEGQTYLGFTNVNVVGNNFTNPSFSVPISAPLASQITAKATNLTNNNTSEFSLAIPNCKPIITSVTDVSYATCVGLRSFVRFTAINAPNGIYSVDLSGGVSTAGTMNNGTMVIEVPAGTLIDDPTITHSSGCASDYFLTTFNLISTGAVIPPAIQSVAIVNPTRCDKPNGKVIITLAAGSAGQACNVDLNNDGTFEYTFLPISATNQVIIDDLEGGITIGNQVVISLPLLSCISEPFSFAASMPKVALPNTKLAVKVNNPEISLKDSTFIIISNTQPEVSYQLRDTESKKLIKKPFVSSGGTVSLTSEILSKDVIYEIVAVDTASKCTAILEQLAEIKIIYGLNPEDSLIIAEIYKIVTGRDWDIEKPLSKWSRIITLKAGRVINLDLSNLGLKGAIPPIVRKLRFLTILNIRDNFYQFGAFETFFITPTPFIVSYSPQLEVLETKDTTAIEGSDVSFDTKIEGENNRYQWLKNNIPITNNPTAITSFLRLPKIKIEDEGSYTCLITNAKAPQLIIKRSIINLIVKPRALIPSDSLILVKFARALGVDNWVKKWDFTTQVATWQGLIFEKGRIVGVQLIDNNLQGSIPDVFVEGENILTNLRTMNLAQNHITGEIPPSMTFLNNLEYLDISNNLFKGSFSPNIFNIKSLITLWISNNQLDKLPNGISKLSNLKNLFLNNNQLSEVSEDLIGLSNLEILNLQSNQLNILPQNLGNLQKLKFLDISNNELKDLPESINAIQTLEVLLAHNNFFKTISKNLLNLRALNKFTIYNNALEFGSLEPLSAWWLGNSPKDVVYAPQTKIGKPQEALKQVGQNIAISFPTSGTSNQYLWYKNNEPTNITTASFVIENLKASDVGTYTLQVRNSLVPNLILNSENFVLLVDCNTQNATNRPQIQIDGSTFFCGEESINTRFTAISALNIENYQWLLNGAKIGSATEQSYSVKEAGRYRVQIFTKDKCTYTSEEVVVTVSPSYAVSIRRNGDVLEAISERNLTNFEWFFNNTLLPTEAQKNLIARESGSYFVRVRDSQGCPSTSRTENIMITGIKENEIENNIVIFPNPSQDLFYLKTENEMIRQIKVFDVLGKQINDILFSTISNDYMISLKNQSIGMYWLEIHTDKRIFIKKIIKE